MLANWVKEGTATTGTGAIALGGAVAGFVPFSAVFASGDRVLYDIEDGTSREIGIGTLTSGAPWTLTRTKVLETLVAGSYSGTSPAAINLSGAAVVSIASARQSIMPELHDAPVLSGGVHVPHNAVSYGNSGKGGGEFTAQAGRITLTPVTFNTPVKISAIGAHVNTLSAGGNFRMGLYAMKSDGSPGGLICDSGNLSTAATGMILATLASPIYLPAGHYYAADCCDNTTATAFGMRSSGGMVGNFDARYGTNSAQNTGGARAYYDQVFGALPANWPGATGTHYWASFGLVFK